MTAKVIAQYIMLAVYQGAEQTSYTSGLSIMQSA